MKTTTTTIQPPPKETYVLGLTDSEIVSLQALYMLAVLGAVVIGIIVMTVQAVITYMRSRKEKQLMKKLKSAIEKQLTQQLQEEVKERAEVN
jgi:TRAP-type C4-dicarboxylate transport system permease large subunit